MALEIFIKTKGETKLNEASRSILLLIINKADVNWGAEYFLIAIINKPSILRTIHNAFLPQQSEVFHH